MDTFTPVLRSYLNDGCVVFKARPVISPPDTQEIEGVLQENFEQFSLQVAGPPLTLHVETAKAAAELALQACWFLVSDAEPEAELERCLAMPRPPQSPEQHLSADLSLRFLPQVVGRPGERVHPVAADEREGHEGR